MKNIVCVSAIANLAAHCIIAVYDNGSGKKLVSGAPGKIQSCQYADAKVECITIRVPDHLTLEEALQYAMEHLDEVPMPSNLDPAHESMTLDEENCDFEDEPGDDESPKPWQTCEKHGYCTVLGKYSNPTVFDCDKYCGDRPR